MSPANFPFTSYVCGGEHARGDAFSSAYPCEGLWVCCEVVIGKAVCGWFTQKAFHPYHTEASTQMYKLLPEASARDRRE